MLSSIRTVCRNPAFRGFINQVHGRWIASPRKMECSNFLNFSCTLAHRSEAQEDHFSTFSMEAKFDVNEEQLVKKFLALQIRWHPDKFASKSQDEQDRAARESSLINAAYRVLKDPLRRSLYLLERAGFPLEEGTTDMDPEFLMEIMELNEELAAVTDPRKMEKIKTKNTAILERLRSSIAAAFAAQNYPEARKIAARMKYYSNISAKVNHFERERGI